MAMNSKIILDPRSPVRGQPRTVIYGVIIGEDFGITDGRRHFVGAETIILPQRGKWHVEPTPGLGSPEDMMEHHLDFAHWIKMGDR